ncbi:hypothetical protein GGR22_002948 [Flavobacterium gossypii]|uniref:Peptidase C14 caspase domain-containing protein n=1 Tax=Flavobacterium gossypii TaxID=1646119 RepID=A0ABR6DSW0_9FLAO|nr:caspase family protein [Flavobacterium gossypii]MBA9074775.1 hypothetical protein [Flavobacterium gossypii]
MKTTSYIRLQNVQQGAIFLCSCLLFISCTMKTDKMETTEGLALPQGTGYALLVGAARTSLSGYSNVFTESAPYNVDALERILIKNDFQEQHIAKLHSPKADVLKANLLSQLHKLTENDLFVFYFFGHGDQVPDTGVLDETGDNKDEVLITADRKLVDDEIYEILTSIKTKARVLFIVDACNSGTIYKSMLSFRNKGQAIPAFGYLEAKQDNGMQLDFLYLGATQDGSIATVYGSTSPFTSLIESVLKDKSFEGNYKDYFGILSKAMWEDKIFPTFETGYASPQFLEQQPFKIN